MSARVARAHEVVVVMPWQHTRGSALLGWVGDDA